MSLLRAKAEGADIRMVYSSADALKIARENPDREVVFFAIGFETTTPPTAVALRQARAEGLKNFSVFANHVLTPSAIQNILESPEVRELGTIPLDGFIGPSHVSTIIGSRPYEFFAEEFQKPVVIAGFEPLDVLQSVLMLVRQLNEGSCRGREPVQPRGDPRGQPEGAGAGRRGVRTARPLRVARDSARCPTARCASARPTGISTPSIGSVSRTARCRTTRPASAARSCAG
jgi:hydrogenase expression/formation protein HypD